MEIDQRRGGSPSLAAGKTRTRRVAAFAQPYSGPGQAWLEMRVREAAGSGSHYEQRSIFYPHGIAGRIYWYVGLPLHRNRFRQVFRNVTARAAAAHGNGS
ncbi:putative oxidoreductase [Mycobacterium xenopi 4042]|uniref:Putative oxidoreductase n=1 Tax=Mycobacterium xenopi 4042 TaxID=1299334 RepID=X8DLC2_MYCXE|nr:putative oxidoreductase [Mycobacterium xenopi 4042]